MPNSSPPSRATQSLARTPLDQQFGDLDQRRVAGLVAEAVVEHLEAVEIDEQHRRRRRRSGSTRAISVSSWRRKPRRLGKRNQRIPMGELVELLDPLFEPRDFAAQPRDLGEQLRRIATVQCDTSCIVRHPR